VHNLNAQSEYYTMQPAPGPSLVCRYGAFTYGRIGTYDKSMFGLPLCQMPGERKMKRETQIKRMRERGERERSSLTSPPVCAARQASKTLGLKPVFASISFLDIL
ncbi:hypothetical protein ALC57_17215, partial [Trachymyrmex cornetzi]